MSQTEEHQVRLQIERIIDRSRHEDEMFLIDSKTAATNILNYLKKENLLTTSDAQIESLG